MTTRNIKINNWYNKKRALKYQEDKSPQNRAYQSRFRDLRTEIPNYSFDEFKKHIEAKFIFYEIGWFNYGSYWEVDHIIQLCRGGLDIIENLQPLPINKNRSKVR